MSGLVHPQMMQSLYQHFFPQSAALQRPTKSRNAAGEEVITFSTPEGRSGIPCRVSPAKGSERRRASQKYVEATHTVLLQGQIHDLTEEWQVVVDGMVYDIQAVELDAEGVMTSLYCRVLR